MWANAYFKAGTLNTGFDTWVDSVRFNSDNTEMTAQITSFTGGGKSTVLAVLDDEESRQYTATLDGVPVPLRERFKGTIELTLTLADQAVHEIKIF